MIVKSFPTLMVLMLVAVMALEASAAETQVSTSCKVKCGLSCLGAPDPEVCYEACLIDCEASKVETLEGQCNLGCVLSKCFNSHLDSKKVKACVNSCTGGCKKF
ncbi:hypothetical protein ACJRO7_022553 [Eucalyptus globulus]|uniref:Thionin-like protein 2 n=1 Tax=Eucalyptus globulus TaxID=34317 RepID=A0ABD3K3Q7_EUCGL